MCSSTDVLIKRNREEGAERAVIIIFLAALGLSRSSQFKTVNTEDVVMYGIFKTENYHCAYIIGNDTPSLLGNKYREKNVKQF